MFLARHQLSIVALPQLFLDLHLGSVIRAQGTDRNGSYMSVLIQAIFFLSTKVYRKNTDVVPKFKNVADKKETQI